VIISIHLGTDDQGQQRKAALEKLAEKYGLTWNDGPSIGKLVVSIADGKIELVEAKDA